MNYQNLISLIEKLENNTASSAETLQLDEFYNSFEIREGYTHTIENQALYDEKILARIKLAIAQQQSGVPKFIKLWPYIAAAVVLLVLSTYLFKPSYFKQENSANTEVENNDIRPGQAGATLTFANGKKIKLSDATNGQQINNVSSSDLKTNMINTLSTAKGETYMVILPDQSRVWLNAGSSLTYAAALLYKGIRKVKLEGEAYFEITKDLQHPFIVESREQEIKVLGTHFNVNNYTYEDDVKITLLEGSLQITPLQNPEKKVILKPGEQAVASKKFLNIFPNNTEVAIAWKQGYFHFENDTLKTILNRLAYWYKVDFIYENDVSELMFSGRIARKHPLKDILKLLALTGKVEFRTEGRKVYVSSH